MIDQFNLDGQVIVVTGGLGKLGRIFATALADAGASIAIFDIAEHNPDSQKELDENQFSYHRVDITQRSAIENGLSEVLSQLGTPTGLLNAAALDSPPNAPAEENGPFESYPEESWDQIMAVNAKGVFLCCQVIGGAMARAEGGTIVNVASIYGALSPDQSLYAYRRKRGEPFFKPVAYTASKSALYNLTRYLATYWASSNVRVNTITFAGVFDDQDPEFLEKYIPKVPLGRMANPDDYTGPIIFLLSDASRYMTGANLVVDGGFSAW